MPPSKDIVKLLLILSKFSEPDKEPTYDKTPDSDVNIVTKEKINDKGSVLCYNDCTISEKYLRIGQGQALCSCWV